jgi:hypothetical protein
LFAAPEMALRSPGEVEVKRRGANEGDGIGFDGLDPSALAERMFEARGDLNAMLAWYDEQLRALGWHEVQSSDDVRFFNRDPEERIAVQVLARSFDWSEWYGRPGPHTRVVYTLKAEASH